MITEIEFTRFDAAVRFANATYFSECTAQILLREDGGSFQRLFKTTGLADQWLWTSVEENITIYLSDFEHKKLADLRVRLIKG